MLCACLCYPSLEDVRNLRKRVRTQLPRAFSRHRHLIIDVLIFSEIVMFPISAQAGDGPAGFRSPSGNISCQSLPEDGEAVLRCDIREKLAVPPPQPKDCDLEWGDAYAMTSRGNRVELICHGDTVFDRSLMELPYGAVWQQDGFTCKSETSGITCFNDDRHGFSISRIKQMLF